jgi:hypothetical protein
MGNVPSLAERLGLLAVSEMECAPISSVHVWLDRPLMDLPHAVLVGRLSQWVFQRSSPGAVTHEGVAVHATSASRFYYQVVVSASRGVETLGRDETIARVVEELQQVWPAGAKARVLHARLVQEHRAVFSPMPGVEAIRPPQSTSISNLHLAGDWTQTGWPSTMEGAVRSGYLAAESVLRSSGTPQSILQPDLPRGTFARWLLGASASG